VGLDDARVVARRMEHDAQSWRGKRMRRATQVDMASLCNVLLMMMEHERDSSVGKLWPSDARYPLLPHHLLAPTLR
jgi:hypothetical protein